MKQQKMTVKEYKELANNKRSHKYNAKKTEYNGQLFDSKAEADYCALLDYLVKTGEIVGYLRQVKFCLPSNVPENKFFLDFVVFPTSSQAFTVDIKGVETSKFKRLRRLWVKYAFLELRIIKRKNKGWDQEILYPER